MADDQTQTAAPDDQQSAVLQQMLQQLQAGPPQPQVDTTPVKRGWLSLLGEAIGGGAQTSIPMSPHDRETAGLRALGDFGTGLMAASRYQPGQTVWSNLAGGFQGAEQSLGRSEQLSAAQLGAQQDYAQKQQEMQIARIKEALPLLTLQQQLAQAAASRKLLGGGGGTPTSIGAAGTGGIGAVGEPPVIARDPNAGTAGQQANNSGNLMVPKGGALPPGAIGVVPLPGDRQVAAFPDAATGIAAQSDNLAAYQAQHGINTIRGAVTRWVGDPKADLGSYVADIAKAAGVDPDAPVDLTDPKIQRAFFLAQQPHESGKPWLNPTDVDKGIALAQARRQGAKPPGAPVVAGAPQAPPPASTAPPAPVAGRGTPIPAGRPTGPPIITDQPPAGSATVAGPPGTATVGKPLPPSPAVPGDVNAIIGGMTGQGASPTTLAPGPSAAAPTAPPPAVVAAATPQAATPPPVTAQPQQPPTPPQFPDVVQGDVVTRHPGSFADFVKREAQPLPTTEDFNPNLSAATQAAFAARRAALEQAKANIGNLPLAQQPAETSKWLESSGALNAEMQSAAAAKAEAAAAATTKFNDTQNKNVQDRYQTAVSAYNDAAKAKAGFNQDIVKTASGKQGDFNNKLLEPYQTGATQAQQILPNIDLAKQVVAGLPANAAPYLESEGTRGRLAVLERFMPANWKEAVQSADTFQQVMGGLVSQMGGNVVSGQPGGRESAYEQFKSMLPTLSQSQEGRERALIFMEQLAQRRIAENTFMQNYAMDPKNRDPELKVANMSGALPAMNAALGPMVRMPPARYDPNVAGNTPEGQAHNATYMNYFNKVKPGEQYITYTADDAGKYHPVVRQKAQGQTKPEAVTE